MRARAVLGLLALGGLGCDPERPAAPPGLVQEARLGVFYGGQVQQRDELPRVLDQTRQSQGFRVSFREPLARQVEVRWEVEMPGPRGRSQPMKLSKLGQLSVPAGRERLDQILPFEPGDPLGVYNVRVLVDEQLVIDHAWLVFDPTARKRAIDAASRSEP